MVYPTHYEHATLESISESLRKRFALNETPEKKPTRNIQGVGADRYTKTMKGSNATNAEKMIAEQIRSVDTIITEESSKNILATQSPDVETN